MNKRLHVHIKNNRGGEEIFRTTPALWRQARARHPEVAADVRATIGWDLDRFDSAMRTANVLVTWDLPTENLRALAPKLENIHIIGAGIEHLQPLDWLPDGVTLTNNSGVHAAKTADYVTMALLMLNNGLAQYTTDQRAKRWNPAYATTIAGKTVTVVGVGAMGGAAARAAKALGLHVLGVRRSGRPARDVDEMATPSALRGMLRRSDFVVVTAPLTKETKLMIDANALDALPVHAGLINLARAELVDYEYLAGKLVAGTLSGAILDVTSPEPLPRASPYWTTPNLVLTPHISSDDAATYVPLTLDLVFENLARLLAGRRLKNRVDPARGY